MPELEVYKAINAVSADLTKEGITKDRKNQQQGYNFRGIDDVYNVLSPLLAKHNLCVIPRMLHRECTERQTKSGGALFYVAVDAEFDFVSAIDGSRHTAKTYGEAMDSADKATNKAMSAAYKYVCFMTFAIPTEGDNDADAQTPPQVAPRQQTPPPNPAPKVEPINVERLVATLSKLESVADIDKICESADFKARKAVSNSANVDKVVAARKAALVERENGTRLAEDQGRDITAMGGIKN